MNQIMYDCEIHGLIEPNVVTVLNDKPNGVLTLALTCNICDKIKSDETTKRAKRKPESIQTSLDELWMESSEWK